MDFPRYCPNTECENRKAVRFTVRADATGTMEVNSDGEEGDWELDHVEADALEETDRAYCDACGWSGRADQTLDETAYEEQDEDEDEDEDRPLPPETLRLVPVMCFEGDRLLWTRHIPRRVSVRLIGTKLANWDTTPRVVDGRMLASRVTMANRISGDSLDRWVASQAKTD